MSMDNNTPYISVLYRDPETGMVILGTSYNPRTGIDTEFTVINDSEIEYVTILNWMKHCEDRIAEKTEIA